MRLDVREPDHGDILPSRDCMEEAQLRRMRLLLAHAGEAGRLLVWFRAWRVTRANSTGEPMAKEWT